MKETTPRYNLKVIVRETGIKADTLRAWERRYELPMPQRTEGGHRLYSQRDLETVKWLMARDNEGLRIGQAVELWRELEASGRDPLREATAPPANARVASEAALSDLAALREAWIKACLAFDEEAAEQQMARALARHAPEIVSLELLQKGLSEIGHLWYEGKATVQQEHFASAVALRRINALPAAAPTPTRSQLIFLACPPREEHAFPLRLLTLLLRYRGWPASFLGANLPVERLEEALQAQRPALFVLAAQTLPVAATALDMARFLQARETPLAYGGLIFNQLPRLRDKMPGYFLGERLEDAPQRIAEILTAGPEMPGGEPVAEAYGEALACFESQRRLLEGQVWQRLEAEGMAAGHLQVANEHLGMGIRAALTFGDMSLMDHEIDWIQRLLANQGIPEAALARYLAVYEEAARERLDGRCELVLAWLGRVGNEKG